MKKYNTYIAVSIAFILGLLLWQLGIFSFASYEEVPNFAPQSDIDL